MTLAPYVKIVAQGKGRARPLTQDEAFEAMTLILRGDAAPEAIGALLMVMRLRGEIPEEIAGFTSALRAFVAGKLPPADLDWPSYAAGRSRGAPLYLLSARLVAQAGYRVSMHGWNSHQKTSRTVEEIRGLVGPQVKYHPLMELSPEAFKILKLRDVLGLRSCFNTVLRMWNPSNADATVQGVFHPSYRSLQAQAAALLGQNALSIIKGGGGEFERHPSKDITVFGLRDGDHIEQLVPAELSVKRRLHEAGEEVDPTALWDGSLQDEFAQATVIGTTALALWTLKAAPTAADTYQMAQNLWDGRHSSDGVTP